MKIYIAARHALKKEIAEVYELLELRGHFITNKWTEQKSIKPYQEHRKEAQQYIAEDLAGITNADVVIFYSEYSPDARGCYIELGYALSQAESRSDLQIYVIEPGDNPSMFFFHPKITIVKDINEIVI